MSRYIKPPTFSSDSEECPDPFAYVPLKSYPRKIISKKRSSRKRSPRKNSSCKGGKNKTSVKTSKTSMSSNKSMWLKMSPEVEGTKEGISIDKDKVKTVKDVNTRYKAMDDPNDNLRIKVEKGDSDNAVVESDSDLFAGDDANAVEESDVDLFQGENAGEKSDAANAVEESDADFFEGNNAVEDSDADLFEEDNPEAGGDVNVDAIEMNVPEAGGDVNVDDTDEERCEEMRPPRRRCSR